MTHCLHRKILKWPRNQLLKIISILANSQTIRLIYKNQLQQTIGNWFFKYDFIYTLENIKYLGTNLKKTWKTSILKNIKHCRKELKNIELTKWRCISVSQIRGFNIAKTSVFSKLIYRFNVISIKIPESFLKEIDKLLLKCIWKCHITKIAKEILRKGEQSCRTYLT